MRRQLKAYFQKLIGIAGKLRWAKKQVWNEESRENLRENIRRSILGELRLAKRDREEIIEACRAVYIEDICPKRESDAFIQFAIDELGRAAILLASEQATWPEETDCDRLDRVEVVLRERGILLWQASPCCHSCTCGELWDRIDVIDQRQPGFRAGYRGYAFFIDQNMPESLSESTELTVYLAYGWFSPANAEVDPQVYEENALGIAREVCDCLRNEGFEADYNGDLSRKIGLSLTWQRRKALE